MCHHVLHCKGHPRGHSITFYLLELAQRALSCHFFPPNHEKCTLFFVLLIVKWYTSHHTATLIFRQFIFWIIVMFNFLEFFSPTYSHTLTCKSGLNHLWTSSTNMNQVTLLHSYSLLLKAAESLILSITRLLCWTITHHHGSATDLYSSHGHTVFPSRLRTLQWWSITPHWLYLQSLFCHFSLPSSFCNPQPTSGRGPFFKDSQWKTFTNKLHEIGWRISFGE